MALPKGPSGGDNNKSLPSKPNSGLPTQKKTKSLPSTNNDEIVLPSEPSLPLETVVSLPEDDKNEGNNFSLSDIDESIFDEQEPYGNISDDDTSDSDVHDHTQEKQESQDDEKSQETKKGFAKAFGRKQKDTKKDRKKNKGLKQQAGEVDEKGQNVFIDKKNKKILPFGGKKSTIRVDDLDQRKNIKRKAFIVQVIVIGLFVVILGFAVKNAFFPQSSLKEEDVQNIIYASTGTKGFPEERGSYFAQSFMQAYLSYNPGQDDASAVLQYFSKGALESGGVVDGTSVGKNFKQTIISGPIVYRTQQITANSALYTVGALVNVENTSTDSTNTTTTQNASTDTASTSGGLVWKFYSINVYYDKDKNAFAIASAPIIVPTPEVINSGDVPDRAKIGTGEEIPKETLEKMTPTIYGFLSAFQVSTTSNYNQLLPFLEPDPSDDLLNGLGGVYDFKGGKADNQSVQVTAYSTDTDLIKAVITVTWVENAAGAYAENKSSYVMNINPVASGYKVTRFIPLAYVPSEKK